MQRDVKRQQRADWGSAIGYHRLSEHFMPAIDRLIDWLEIGPDDRVLDIGTGTGRAAVAARATGASVTGQDFSPILLSEAMHYAVGNEFHDITFDEADFEDLPYPNSSFTVVLSTFGVVHGTRANVVADEMDRVLAGSGRLGLATWHRDCGLFDLLRLLIPYGSNELTDTEISLWSRPEGIQDVLVRRAIPRLEFDTGDLMLSYPDPESAWREWRTHYGPFRSLYASLSTQRRQELDGEATSFFSRLSGPDGTVEWRLRYLLAHGRKRPGTSRLG